MEVNGNSVKQIADIAREGVEPRVVSLQRGNESEASVLVLPTGHKAESLKPILDQYRTAPERRKGTARLVDLDSFIALVNRFKDADSAIWGLPDSTSPSLTCVFDYHRATADGSPRFGEHRAVYAFPLSDEWKKWATNDGEKMSQRDFAEFVEGRVRDIANPTGVAGAAAEDAKALGVDLAPASRIVEVARGLMVRVKSEVAGSVALSSGEVEIKYSTQHQDERGQPLRVPSAFLIGIPVFQGGDLYPIVVRLRYRADQPPITWFYELYGTERVFDFAFKKACDRATTDTALPLFFGSPES